MKDRSDELSHHEQTTLPWSYISLLGRFRREKEVCLGVCMGVCMGICMCMCIYVCVGCMYVGCMCVIMEFNSAAGIFQPFATIKQ